jgi:hypothetical protein
VVNATARAFGSDVPAWLAAEPAVQSAVLFGSGAKQSAAAADNWSDFDLHLVVAGAEKFERVDWTRALPDEKLCLQVARPATGGVRKVTAVFACGQIDLVLVPSAQMRLVRFAMGLGLQRRLRFFDIALNEMATCLATGYRFLKGEKQWGSFYARVAAEMPGVRLGDAEVRQLADVFLCELLWVQQKLERGEFAAAQLALHRSLAETNFRLVRELQLRRREPLPSFGLARRVETLLRADELARVSIDAPLEREALRRAAWQSFEGLAALVRELVPEWKVPPPMLALLASYRPTPAR